MEETFNKMQALLALTNETFDFDLKIENDEVLEVKIKGLKNDGTKFVAEFVDILENIVKLALPEYELVYNAEEGFSLIKK